jgi:hypothetical protein
MKPTVFLSFALILSLGLSSCNGQSAKEKKGEPVKGQNDTTQNLPKTDIKVNKEYDEKGNLIRYDSAYSSFYSNISGDSLLGDSLLNEFKSQFNKQYFFSQRPFFQDFFFQDSLLQYDFYKNDFFSNRFRNNWQRMDSIFLQMDSIKNKFFQQQLLDPDNKKK